MQISDYSFGDRLLHRLALGVPFISKVSFELDTLFHHRTDTLDKEGRHVFISGLARSGTTILMRTLFDTGLFRSLTYRDMPFVLMPCVWKKLSASFYKQKEAEERAHGDGIEVSFDSPEAFEEAFWRTFCGKDYIFDNRLQPHRVNDDVTEQFRTYISSVQASSGNPGQQRYLSKNNNNILRLDSIRKAFPRSLIIIPFRDPVQQAASLLNQHQQFLERHAVDSFAYDYMRWLGHHEFGATHKPFRFKKDDSSCTTGYTADNINYWLALWRETNAYILRNAPSDSIFVCFEELCDSPSKTLSFVFEAADIPMDANKVNAAIKAPPIKDAQGVDEDLKISIYDFYNKLTWANRS